MAEQRNYIAWAILVIVALLAFSFFMKPGTEERLSNAANEVGEGIEDAKRELDPNPTTGEQIGGAIEDLGEDIQDAADSDKDH
jgi:F0F1-type ATP synthase membrane subunit b/b'